MRCTRTEATGLFGNLIETSGPSSIQLLHFEFITEKPRVRNE